MTRAEYLALNVATRGVVERAVSALQAIGLSREGALSLLAIQASIRMDDQAKVRELIRDIKQHHGVNDDDDEPFAA